MTCLRDVTSITTNQSQPTNLTATITLFIGEEFQSTDSSVNLLLAKSSSCVRFQEVTVTDTHFDIKENILLSLLDSFLMNVHE